MVIRSKRQCPKVAVLCNGDPTSRCILSMCGTLLSAKTPTMLARDDKPGVRGVDVTESYDQRQFSKFSKFAEKFVQGGRGTRTWFSFEVPAQRSIEC